MNKIAFQGIEGSYSQIVCKKHYSNMEAIPYKSFAEVFNAVQNDEVKYGIIPLENSYAGRVAEIHNLLQMNHVSIVAEHFCRVNHNLAGIKGAKLEDVDTIYSHPQALMQCKDIIRDLKVETIGLSNTAKAAQDIALLGDKTKAVICSREAINIYGLDILQEGVSDIDDNTTIFVAISKEVEYPDINEEGVITTLLFTIRNIPAALYKSLGGFATNNVNMIKLESYIAGGSSKQAQFFISFEGHPDEDRVQLALEELGFFSQRVKLLGVYKMDSLR